MNYYVEIPYGVLHTVQFPNRCPFTLRCDPDTTWQIEGHTKSSGIAVPAVPVMIAKGRKYLLSMPVSQAFVDRQRQLAWLAGLLVFPFLLILAINSAASWFDDIHPILFLIPLAGVLVYGFKKFLQRYVWIDYVGTDVIEIAFKRRSYAEEFCELNGLEFRRKLINLRAG